MKFILPLLLTVSILPSMFGQIQINCATGQPHGVYDSILVAQFSPTAIIYENWFSSYYYNPPNPNILITTNPYISYCCIEEYIYENKKTLNVFAGANHLSQVASMNMNYSENVVTTCVIDSDTILNHQIHPKCDVGIDLSYFNIGNATSWSSDVIASLCYNLVAKNDTLNSSSSSLKAALINSTRSKILDTSLLSKQVLIKGNLDYGKSSTVTFPLNGYLDSLKYTFSALDRPTRINDLDDTVTLNGTKMTSTTFTETLYNLSELDLEVGFNCCDSNYTTFEVAYVYDTIVEYVEIVILSDSSFYLLSDSIRGFWQIDTLGISLGRLWRYKGVVQPVNYYNLDTSRLGDTLNLTRTYTILNHYDTTFNTEPNILHYGISFIPYYKIITTPVELTYFRGERTEEGNLLKWQTASEESNSHFEVEHSINGLDFEIIGYSQGKGTTTVISDYSFLDKTPSLVNYYRLKQVDYDGNFEYSDIVIIKSDIPTSLEILGNPFKDILTVRGSGKLEIFNNLGQSVFSINLKKGITNIELKTVGVYYLLNKKEVYKVLKVN